VVLVVGGDVLSLVAALRLHRLPQEHGFGADARSLARSTNLLIESHVAFRRQSRPNADRVLIDAACLHLANRNE